MQFAGHYLLGAPRPTVWAALNDTAILKAAIPGCERLIWTGEDALEVAVRVDLGVLHPLFSGELSLSGVVPAERYRLAGRGRGGLLGLAHGAADIVLADANQATDLVFLASGGASSMLMRLGRALLGDSAQAIIDSFFERFAAAMGVSVVCLDPDLTAIALDI